MDGVGLIQDLAIVLVAAGLAGVLCRRLGLSVIVGYLFAGIVIGPYTPPFSLLQDVDRIQTLSQVGLVFLMFGIGLGLSLSKLGRMGWPTLLATALGAFFVLNLTRILGFAVGWSGTQSLFMASMFMVSSSAVIAKIVAELNLTHERAAQQALSITVLEDVVAVTMLTVLGAQSHGEPTNVGQLLTGLTAFIVLLVGVGLLMVPRLMRRLEARADPELQTIIVAGLLFMLALAAVKAGYSLALGAFLLGAIVAEIPQKTGVERAFTGMRDLFSSVFFVSIGMMIEVKLLADVWLWVLGLGVFVLVARAFATTLALILCGTPPSEARRAGLLLGPLGEFSFIIAQMGVSAAVLPPKYYPMSVGVSIFTVLLVPLINRFAVPVVALTERLEPAWLRRAIEAYQTWLAHLQATPTSSTAWRFIRGRLLQLGVEILLVTGIMLFSGQLLGLIRPFVAAVGLAPATIDYGFWAAISIVALIPLVAIWRNLSAITMIYAESVASARLPSALVQNVIKAVAAIAIVFWLYAIVPLDQLGGWGWLVIGAVALLVITIYSRKLIYWFSEWQTSVRDVLAETPEAAAASRVDEGRRRRQEGLQGWDVKLSECVVPDGADYGGQTLAQLSIPARFGCAVLEIERNGIVITAVRPELRIFPGDKLLLLGRDDQVRQARETLERARPSRDEADEFEGSVLETYAVPEGSWSGKTLAQLNIGQLTGTRIVGIKRGGDRIIAPSGAEVLHAGDDVLVTGTMGEIARFRRWFKSGGRSAGAVGTGA
jgi:CPA2 family monovalent cation:H+ antiporter-2